MDEHLCDKDSTASSLHPCSNASVSDKRPCRYKRFGCTYEEHGENSTDHHTDCSFRPMECPFQFQIPCTWIGRMNETVLHCLKKHWNQLYAYKLRVVVDEFKYVEPTGTSTIMCLAFGRLFRYSGTFIPEQKRYRVGCYYYGEPLEFARFRFEVSFYQESDMSAEPRFSYVCCPIKNSEYDFDESCYIDVDYSQWKNFCFVNGALHYQLEIIDNKMDVDEHFPSGIVNDEAGKSKF
ncbi:uncharacterized protein isoform X1 [Leptinotarsa decemlineata]|uniref:uncharacterized protein isoform X1 n=1 Tax=Leptinotarsa decemlineata TaxID=7539 RepID=UPI003D30641A